jgi:hypothetical protein
MATTTPNYGWDVPTSTDYVKDGATAIETLGDDIDASLFSITSGKNVGLVHINTTSFTNQTSVIMDNILPSTISDYRFVLTLTNAAATTGVNLIGRNGTSDISSTVFSQRVLGFGTTLVASETTGTQIALIGNTFPWASFSYDLTNTQQTTQLKIANGMGIFRQNGGAREFASTGIGFSDSSIWNGIKLTSTSNISGTIRIYGYRNS